MKIQTKIALLFTFTCTLIIIILSGAVYHFASQKAFHDFFVRLELRATIAAKANLDEPTQNSDVYEQIRNSHLQRLPQEQEYIVKIDTFKNFAAGRLNGQVPLQFFNDILQTGKASYRKGFRFYEGMYYRGNGGDYAVIISAYHSYASNFADNLKTILVVANIISMIVLFSVGIVFSKQVLLPIRKITKEVHNINTTWLHKRLTVKDGNDEIAELASTFNNMLIRLETSFETQNNFVSNASHELNTPLTAIIGEAQFTLLKPRSPEQYQQGLQVILRQAEKLKNITKSLLELAQSGFTGNLSFEQVKVSDLLQNVEKVAASIYPECNLRVDYSLLPSGIETLTIPGNFHLLELCISNIVMNACKYSAGDQVTLAFATSDKHAIFIVNDKGIGIPEADMPHLFDPFFRASNVKGAQGYGIGLPLAQNIIKLHRGEIHISSRVAEGTEVVVKIPKA